MPSPPGPAGELERWIEAARAGSAEALGRVFEACRPYLLAIAERELPAELRAKCGASDLLQDAYLKIHDEFQRFAGTGREEVLAWLRRVLLNHVANVRAHYLNAKKRQIGREAAGGDSISRASFAAIADPAPTPRTQAEHVEELAVLERVLGQLAPRHARVIRLRYWGGRTFPEIAAELGCSAEAARKLWLRAVEKMHAIMEASDESPTHPPAE